MSQFDCNYWKEVCVWLILLYLSPWPMSVPRPNPHRGHLHLESTQFSRRLSVSQCYRDTW